MAPAHEAIQNSMEKEEAKKERIKRNNDPFTNQRIQIRIISSVSKFSDSHGESYPKGAWMSMNESGTPAINIFSLLFSTN